jgi:hypothetical protein
LAPHRRLDQELQLCVRLPVRLQRAYDEGLLQGLLGMRIRDGHFGDVRLDGLSFFVVVDFPGPLHEGNGTVQPIIDEHATPAQREALSEIMSGKNSAEGTLFHIVTLIASKMLDPIFAPIHVEFDMPGRRAKLSIPGVLETENEPIKNPVTGAPHRIQINMPDGFEHRLGEVCSSRISSTGGIKFEVPQGHGTLATVTHTPQGVAA